LVVGYAIAELSNLSTLPITAQYADAKRLLHYLHQMRTYVLVYWHLKPLGALPQVPFPHFRPLDEVDRQMHMPSSIGVMCGYLDSTHVNCLCTRRNDRAHVFFLAGTAIAYRAKCISVICLSSIDCVFVTSIGAAKVKMFIYTIIIEISIRQVEATELYKYNLHATFWYRTSGVVYHTVSSTYTRSSHPKRVHHISAMISCSSISLLRLVFNYFDCISSLGINTLVDIG
jgi:hypothetical protein